MFHAKGKKPSCFNGNITIHTCHKHYSAKLKQNKFTHNVFEILFFFNLDSQHLWNT